MPLIWIKGKSEVVGGTFADNAECYFGTGQDVTLAWTGSDFHVDVAADDTVLNVGDGTDSADLKWFGSAGTEYWYWDASADTLKLVATAGILSVTSASATAFAVGRLGTTTPAFSVDASTGSQAAGLKVTGAATTGTVAVDCVGGAAVNLTVDAKGTGTVGIATVSTGAVTIGAATGVTGALTVTSAGAGSLSVGRLGATTPAFCVDSSTGSQVAGLKLTGAATGGTVAVVCTDSGADTSLTIDAKGAGTIKLGNTSTGAVTIKPATTITGALTPTGGVAAAGGFTQAPYGISTFKPVAATDGTDTAMADGKIWVGSVNVPANTTVTGIGYLIGSVGGTDKAIVSLYDSAGALLANSALAGATVGTAANSQEIALTAPLAVKGPATYYVGITTNGTTAKLRTIPAFCNAGVVGNQLSQVFGTCAAIVPPTTFTADKVPVAWLY